MAEIRQLTEEEKALISYFHTQRGQLSRWTGWEVVQPILAAHHPEVLKALHDRDVAETILDAVIDHLTKE